MFKIKDLSWNSQNWSHLLGKPGHTRTLGIMYKRRWDKGPVCVWVPAVLQLLPQCGEGAGEDWSSSFGLSLGSERGPRSGKRMGPQRHGHGSQLLSHRAPYLELGERPARGPRPSGDRIHTLGSSVGGRAWHTLSTQLRLAVTVLPQRILGNWNSGPVLFSPLFLILEKGEGRQKDKERHIDAREKYRSDASCTCPNRQPRHAP